jgi:hypothetical protein
MVKEIDGFLNDYVDTLNVTLVDHEKRQVLSVHQVALDTQILESV